MKIWAFLFVLLAAVLFVAAGRSSESSSSSSSSESNSSWERRNFFRGARCILRPTDSSSVGGNLFLYQKHDGNDIYIKGGLRGLGPEGTKYALTFHNGYPSRGNCANAGEPMSNVGGDFAFATAHGDYSGDGVNTSSRSIRLEEGFDNSVIGRSIVVRQISDGRRVACCAVDRERQRGYRY